MVELKKNLAIVLYCIFIDHKIRHEIYITYIIIANVIHMYIMK